MKIIDADKLLSVLSKDIIWHSQWLIIKKVIDELSEDSEQPKPLKVATKEDKPTGLIPDLERRVEVIEKRK